MQKNDPIAAYEAELAQPVEPVKEDSEQFVPSDIKNIYGDPTPLDLQSDDPDFEAEAEDASPFDYEEGHLDTARFALSFLDRIISAGLAVFAKNDDFEAYRRRKVPADVSDDYELQALASIIKKYQVKMSVEFIFVSAIVMGYAPMFTQAALHRNAKAK